MLFDKRIEKKDITYTYEDPKMYDYLNEIFSINNKYQNKFIELKETMNIIKNETVKKDNNHQLYVDSVSKYISDISEEFFNFSEEINNLYNKFIDGYSTLSESENIILNNIDYLLNETLFFNGHLYNLDLNNINLMEDFLSLDDRIYDKDMLISYVNLSLNEQYYNNLRGKILNENKPISKEDFIDRVYDKFLLNGGDRYNTRLLKEEKELLLESILDTEEIQFRSKDVIDDINDHYTTVINYFNEMSNELVSTNINDYYAYTLLTDAKLNECMNTMIMYNEVLGVYLNTVNKRNTEYNNFFNQIL